MVRQCNATSQVLTVANNNYCTRNRCKMHQHILVIWYSTPPVSILFTNGTAGIVRFWACLQLEYSAPVEYGETAQLDLFWRFCLSALSLQYFVAIVCSPCLLSYTYTLSDHASIMCTPKSETQRSLKFLDDWVSWFFRYWCFAVDAGYFFSS